MTSKAWESGANAALDQYGLRKHSSWGNAAGQLAKEILIGKPGEYFRQAQSGQLFTRSGLIAQHLDPRSTLGPKWLHAPMTAVNAVGQFAFPAYEVYKMTQAPPEQRGSAVGATLGSTIGTALTAPLGFVGGLAGHVAGSSLGEAVGRNFNSQAPDPYAFGRY